jgi:hypothetical protein
MHAVPLRAHQLLETSDYLTRQRKRAVIIWTGQNRTQYYKPPTTTDSNFLVVVECQKGKGKGKGKGGKKGKEEREKEGERKRKGEKE